MSAGPSRDWLPAAPLHVAALLCLGVSQPILDLLMRHPGFLSAHGLRGPFLLAFALAVAWLPAAALALPLWLAIARLPRSPGSKLAAFLALPLCFSIVGLGFASRWFESAGLACAAALAIVALALTAYLRFPAVRFFVSILSCVLLVAPAAFLVSDAVAPRWLPQRSSAAPAVDSPQPVYLLLFDQFPGWLLATPELEIDRERFPHLAALADVSDYFRTPTRRRPEPAPRCPAC